MSKPNYKLEATIDVHLWHFEIPVLHVSGTACNIVQLRYAVSFGFWGGDRFRGRTIKPSFMKLDSNLQMKLWGGGTVKYMNYGIVYMNYKLSFLNSQYFLWYMIKESNESHAKKNS